MNNKEFLDTFGHASKTLKEWGRITYNSNAPVSILDFFCCGGGMSLGFALLKDIFRIAGGIDINPIPLTTFQENYQVPTLLADISTLVENIPKIETSFNIQTSHPKPLIIIGCAPCQGFSAHRKKHYNKPEDSRNTLIGAFASIAVKFNPDYVVMENVPEILTGKYRHHYEEAKNEFEANGYRIVQKIYNAAGFGVPQARTRAILVATKSKIFKLPEELYSENEYTTVREAIGDLPSVKPGQGDIADPLHRCSHHKQSTIDVIASVPHNGGSRPEGIGPKCLDRVKGFYDVYGRLSWDKPSITITQYARNPASGRFSHPEQNRGLTIREAARLQSFPDGYKWHGTLGEIFKQIGEAVPPLLSLAIASQIALTIKRENDGEESIYVH